MFSNEPSCACYRAKHEELIIVHGTLIKTEILLFKTLEGKRQELYAMLSPSTIHLYDRHLQSLYVSSTDDFGKRNISFPGLV